jgi:hypothetical protein
MVANADSATKTAKSFAGTLIHGPEIKSSCANAKRRKLLLRLMTLFWSHFSFDGEFVWYLSYFQQQIWMRVKNKIGVGLASSVGNVKQMMCMRKMTPRMSTCDARTLAPLQSFVSLPISRGSTVYFATTPHIL